MREQPQETTIRAALEQVVGAAAAGDVNRRQTAMKLGIEACTRLRQHAGRTDDASRERAVDLAVELLDAGGYEPGERLPEWWDGLPADFRARIDAVCGGPPSCGGGAIKTVRRY